MFRNNRRKAAFWIWMLSMPTALLGAIFHLMHLPGIAALGMIAAGIAGSVIGLIVLKTPGDERG